MTFSAPLALLLLITLPYFVWLGRSRSAYRRWRDLISLSLRLLIASLLILGLAGAQLVLAADKLATLFLVDFSDSMGATGRQATIDYVSAALDAMGPDDQAGVILFGADALVERPLSPARTLDQVYSSPLTLNTNLAEAIRLGLALFPPDMARRMVILSDGLATLGDAEAAARLAAVSDVQIDFVSFQRPLEPEVLITNVHTPAMLDEGQIFDLGLTLQSNTETTANVTVLAAGGIMYQEEVELHPGAQSFVLRLQAGAPGFTGFRVVVEPAGDDAFYQNNALSSFSRITGPPRVLVVRQDPQESDQLVRALRATGVLVDEIAPGALPTGLAPLGVYESVILVNVPAIKLSPRRMAVLQVYVRDLGGGLVVVGGSDSYGVGGYYQTALEETLPVDMQIRDQERHPDIALVFAIDRSGSMAVREPTAGYTHLELAKEAVIRSISLLSSMDHVGVVGFDSGAFWVVPLQAVTNPSLIRSMVGTLTAGGGTSIYAAVDAISQVLPSDEAPIKHVVLLSDGGASPAGVRDLAYDMYTAAGVTTSVVAIGQNYAPWIEALPRDTEGRFHYAPDVTTIPTIFTAETILAARSYIVEEDFFPAPYAPSPILTGIGSAPRLRGYVATSAKDTAQVIMVSHQEDPILAAWQYGLGRAVAWTSDVTSKWAANWVGWEDFARFWSQVVRWTITEGANENVEVRVEQRGEQAIIQVDALDREDRYLNGLRLTARIVDPELGPSTAELRQVAPGRYEGVFTPETEGAYFIGLAGTHGEAGASPAVQQTTGWVLSYSPEYRALQADPRLLERVARLTDGRRLTEPAQAFDHGMVAQRSAAPLWPWLLLLAVLLLPLDVAVRRLVITRADLDKAREALAQTFAGQVARRWATEARSGRFEQLKDAKKRASARAPEPLPPAEARDKLPPKPTPARTQPPTGPPHKPTPEAERAPQQPARPAQPEEGEEEGSLVARLLKRRREREGDNDDQA